MPDGNNTNRGVRAQELACSQAIVQALGDPVCVFDEDGRLSYVNEAFERTTGYDSATVCSEPLTLVMDEAAAESVGSLVDSLLADSERVADPFELELERRDGTSLPVECTLSLLSDDADQAREAVLVMRDLSGRKQRAHRLDEFASVVSHDLRNPLDVALGRAEMLPEIADVDDDVEPHLDEIYNSLKRMEHLIEDVLTLTRRGEDTVEMSAVSLATVAREAWGHVDTGAAALSVTADEQVLAHRNRLLRLFENLFRNAVEHAGEDVTVEIGLRKPDRESNTVTFYVADDGPGIPGDSHEQIFDDGFTTGQAGAGLGLAIVREITRAHGWTVEVTDSAHGGARFEFAGVERPD